MFVRDRYSAFLLYHKNGKYNKKGNANSSLALPKKHSLPDKLSLVGKYVNLEYRLPNGQRVKFLDDQTTYLGNQLESEVVTGLCFGILANMDFIMICTHEADGANPELIIYKKR